MYNDFKLLNKNLNFIPNPGRYNKYTFEKDTNAFFRSTILKSHFGNGQAKISPLLQTQIKQKLVTKRYTPFRQNFH